MSIHNVCAHTYTHAHTHTCIVCMGTDVDADVDAVSHTRPFECGGGPLSRGKRENGYVCEREDGREREGGCVCV